LVAPAAAGYRREILDDGRSEKLIESEQLQSIDVPPAELLDRIRGCLRRRKRKTPLTSEIPLFPRPVAPVVMRLIGVFALAFLVSLPLLAAPRRRAVEHPGSVTREEMVAEAIRVADRVAWTYHPRLHWENAVFFDGLVLLGEQLELRDPGSGQRFIDRAAEVLLLSDDPIETVYWGDGTAWAQSALDLYRVLPPGDPGRAALLSKLEGSLQFAQHAIRVAPTDGAPRNPWWVEGGYGTRFWQDDLYMVVPWLALYGASQDTLPGNELARNLAYE